MKLFIIILFSILAGCAGTISYSDSLNDAVLNKRKFNFETKKQFRNLYSKNIKLYQQNDKYNQYLVNYNFDIINCPIIFTVNKSDNIITNWNIKDKEQNKQCVKFMYDRYYSHNFEMKIKSQNNNDN